MNLFPVSLVLSALLLLFGIGTPCAGTIDPSLQRDLDSMPPGENVRVIVTFDDAETVTGLAWEAGGGKRERAPNVVRTLHARAERSQRMVRAQLQEKGRKFQPLWIINGLALDADKALIQSLAAHPGVKEIHPVLTFRLPEVAPSRITPSSWNLTAINAPEVWGQGYDGQGVTVAILDSGVDANHPLLSAKWLGGPQGWFNAAGCAQPERCTPCDLNTTTPCDLDGHGTAVAGIILGGTETTVTGVAPGARWVAAKIFPDNGEANADVIVRALQWVLDPDGNPSTNDAVANIVNGSWGYDPGLCVGQLRPAVQALRAAGIPAVFAAGNGGPAPGTSSSPANYPESIAVGSIDSGFSLTSFSARGPSSCDNTVFPEVVAPGSNITTIGLPTLQQPSPFISLEGTSSSAPHFTGVLALLRHAGPALPMADLSAAAVHSAVDLGPRGADNGYGFGLVDALAALRRIRGEPHMGVHDPAPPENDGRLSFGNVFPGVTATRTVTVYNQGGGNLGIQTTPLTGATPQAFAVIENTCLNALLPPDGTCALTLAFTPQTLGTFSGRLTLTPTSAQSPLVLTVDGAGRNVPTAAQLISPADGAETRTSVTFRWLPGTNPDGEPVVDRLMVSRDPDFTRTVAQKWAPGGNRVLAGAGGLLAAYAAFRLRSRRRLAALLIALLLALLAACGGGSGDGDSDQPGIAQTVSGLNPGLYYWKVRSTNSAGGSAESEIRMIRVQ